MINNPVDNLQIKLLKGSDSLINFALSEKLDEHLSLPRPRHRIREELEYQRIITSQSVIQLPEHLPTNGASGSLEQDLPKTAVAFKLFFGAIATGYLFCEPISKVKISRGEMTVSRFGRQSNDGQSQLRDIQDFIW